MKIRNLTGFEFRIYRYFGGQRKLVTVPAETDGDLLVAETAFDEGKTEWVHGFRVITASNPTDNLPPERADTLLIVDEAIRLLHPTRRDLLSAGPSDRNGLLSFYR